MRRGAGEVMDADYTSVQEVQTDCETPKVNMPEEASAVQGDEAPRQEPVDEELNRFIAMFKLMRESGYTLKIIPGTPEENAPVFDFEAGKIIRPAA